MHSNLVDVLFCKKNKYSILSGSNEDEILNNCAELLNNGSDIIQYYPNFSDDLSVKIGLKIRQLCSMYSSLLIIKSRADIAYLVSADGVMLDKASYGIQNARKIISHEMLIGTDYQTDEADFIISDKLIKAKYLFLKHGEHSYKLVR